MATFLSLGAKRKYSSAGRWFAFNWTLLDFQMDVVPPSCLPFVPRSHWLDANANVGAKRSRRQGRYKSFEEKALFFVPWRAKD